MMTGKAIGTHTHMHKTKVSRAVADLERRKLVRPHVRTGRINGSLFLSLTPSRACRLWGARTGRPCIRAKTGRGVIEPPTVPLSNARWSA